MRAWLLIAAACGGASPTPPVAVTSPGRAIAKTSCADAGVILRGVVEAPSPEAGPDREAAIAHACADDHWSAAALECIGASRTPLACLDKHLSPQLVASYQIALAEWAAKYEASSDIDALVPKLACDDAIGAVDRISDDVTVERDEVLAARKRAVAVRCASGWSQEALLCLASPNAPTDALTSCIARETDKDELAADLAAIAAHANAIAAAKRKPASITCAKVVAAYYADASWKGALGELTPAARKQAIAGSRAAMLRACTTDAWTDTLRACLATGGDATCFSDAGVTSRWGYPAFELTTSSLPPECDEVRLLAATLARCTAVPPPTRSAIAESLNRLEHHAQDDDVRNQCATLADTLRGTPGC
ncbi:MAG TPA: hypothetical protein VH143_15245 [Kofleriaceae bacterium]|jgi:hypothetical protein|nr:hypothetical protein [Kofleriaceae bacterium]